MVKIFIVSLFFLFGNLCYSAENAKNLPCIVYIKGSCSSGKSTFIKSMLSKLNDIEHVDEDSIMQKAYVNAVAERFPVDYSCIASVIAQENLYHAIREKEVLFKKNISENEREKALDALFIIQEELNKSENASWKQNISKSIDVQVLQKIRQAVEKGNTVLLDSWYINCKDLELSFPETKIFTVLLYSSLKNIYERFTQRNDKAIIEENLSEKRYVRQLLGSFISLFQISNQPEQAIDRITKFELQAIFSNIALSLKDGPNQYQKPIFTFEEISKPYFMKLTNELLSSIESDDNEIELYISPRGNYDIILSSENILNNVDLLKKTIQLSCLDSRK